jgi:CheY-like chemotaxis protein
LEQSGINTYDKPHVKVLMIEDNDNHAALILRTLTKAENICFDTEHTGLLSAGLDLLAKKSFDVILSDRIFP